VFWGRAKDRLSVYRLSKKLRRDDEGEEGSGVKEREGGARQLGNGDG
jgi:hypothetical protein